jgi:hypothetical protein
MRLPLATIVVSWDEDLPIDFSQVERYYHMLMYSEPIEPIRVRRLRGGFWQIDNGRHRFIAHLLADMKWIMAVEVDTV